MKNCSTVFTRDIQLAISLSYKAVISQLWPYYIPATLAQCVNYHYMVQGGLKLRNINCKNEEYKD